jgi:hypothetical protein
MEPMMNRNPASETGRTQIIATALTPSEVNPMFPSQPLVGDDRIRLLKIQPGGPDDPICAKMFTVRTSESPAYEALSYTWGDLSRRQRIQIAHMSASGENVVPTWVTSNCHAALKRLRKGATGPRTVWVDSICINQTNISERNHQLTLMTQIYESASCVIVYLGNCADGSDEAMDLIREIDIPSSYDNGRHDEISLLKPDKSMLDALFRRPWFSRVWVLQEVRMARKAVVYCGDRAVNWDSFRAFKDWNVSCHWIDELPYVVTAVPGRYSYLMPAETLIKELRDTRDCQSTDPRDKLFAILPLILQSKTEGFAEAYKAIQMDYHLSPAQVFVNLGKYLLDALGFDILREVAGPSALAGLPSWVPDWSIRPQLKRIRDDFGSWVEHWYDKRTGRVKVLEARNIDGELLYELHGEGRRVGSILLIGDKCDLRNDIFPITQWQTLMPNLESLHHNYRCYKSSRALFWALLGEDFWGQDALDVLEKRVRTYHEGEEARVRAIQGIKARGNNKQPIVDGGITLVDFCEAGSSRTNFQEMERVFVRCDGQRFFVTDTGFLGLGSEYAQVGDSVYYIRGARLPFVLRTNREQFARTAAQEQERESEAPTRMRLIGGCSMCDVKIYVDTSIEKIIIW